ncbi:MAG: C69 family dipeptidase [Alphaproteobacteria bacterium]|nr:C69 family dipeptidase [Alphaproteobacteria bacterium]
MCDSFVALPHRTAAGGMLFAKNSDRERNEAQALEFKPATEHEAGADLVCTYITIPQARRTNACLISRPFWMWGAEMGANEHGVVIGNEAMHSVVAPSETPALTGMDLLRLALERAASAPEAVDVITTLLEAHGQGGNCGHLHPFFYHNGFLIADGREAFVLETVGRSWACERVCDERALSNAYSIGRGYERVSADLAGDPFDFAERFIDLERDGVSFGRGRCARGGQLLASHDGKLTRQAMIKVLRDHGAEGEAPDWTPEKTERRSICMHAAEGARRSQTTASWISEWTPDGVVHWVTASAAPCLSVFKPIVLRAAMPEKTYAPTNKFYRQARWWKHELWHRGALCNYAEHLASITAERDALEAKFANDAHATMRSPERLSQVIAGCWREADEAEARWTGGVRHDGYARCGEAYAASWAEHDRVGMVPPR